MEVFRKRQLVPRDKCINKNDKILVQYAFVFNVYNDICLEDYKKYITNFNN